MKTLLSLFFLTTLLLSATLSKQNYTEQEWGIAGVLRYSSIPYATQEDHVQSFVPLMFFENDYVFIDGLEAGFKAYNMDDWRFSAIVRARFVDIPSQYQNQVQADTIDIGLQARYTVDDNWHLDMELMSDMYNNYHANLTYGATYDVGSWELEPYATLRLKDKHFNSKYYALNQEDIGAGVDYTFGIKTKYHVISNLYLLSGVQGRFLDSNARDAEVVDDNFDYKLYAGVGFFNDKKKRYKQDLGISPYIRVAHGWATPSNMNDILTGNTEKDEYNNQLTSVFYGHPLTDELFGLPLDIYLTPGFIWHHDSSVQSSSQEYVMAIKAYYTIPLPVRFRLGVAEGLSYASQVTYIEQSELDKKEYKESKLLNYIDLSLDVNLEDIFGKNMRNTWLGYSMHHRSGIFEKASQFGRIKGGSNYNTVYLQVHF